ncbi:hypothetical protein CRUP_022189 [Coryphaenoides rupestris]|nr:hypothetical protein CRUP_022189 [Coryphaenoides rupestris]
MLQFCGNKLDKKDFFGKSDPFLVFYRSNEDGSGIPGKKCGTIIVRAEELGNCRWNPREEVWHHHRQGRGARQLQGGGGGGGGTIDVLSHTLMPLPLLTSPPPPPPSTYPNEHHLCWLSLTVAGLGCSTHITLEAAQVLR